MRPIRRRASWPRKLALATLFSPIFRFYWCPKSGCARVFGPSDATRTYNGVVTVILLLTVWFANLAESLAEGRGKAQAAFLRRTKVELRARRVLPSGTIEDVPATILRKGDVVRVEKTDIIPTDG